MTSRLKLVGAADKATHASNTTANIVKASCPGIALEGVTVESGSRAAMGQGLSPSIPRRFTRDAVIYCPPCMPGWVPRARIFSVKWSWPDVLRLDRVRGQELVEGVFQARDSQSQVSLSGMLLVRVFIYSVPDPVPGLCFRLGFVRGSSSADGQVRSNWAVAACPVWDENLCLRAAGFPVPVDHLRDRIDHQDRVHHHVDPGFGSPVARQGFADSPWVPGVQADGEALNCCRGSLVDDLVRFFWMPHHGCAVVRSTWP